MGLAALGLTGLVPVIFTLGIIVLIIILILWVFGGVIGIIALIIFSIYVIFYARPRLDKMLKEIKKEWKRLKIEDISVQTKILANKMENKIEYY